MKEANHRLANLLQRFAPHRVAQELINSSHLPHPGGQRREATILFADARDFTMVAEIEQGQRALDILNAHAHVISEAIRRHEGSLIQYAGDMVMAAFNVPDYQLHHPLKAAQAALDIRDSLEWLAVQRKAASLPVLKYGIGLATGPVVAGYLGDGSRYEYAAVGDTTNVAFHICSKAAGGQILISQTTLEQIDGPVQVSPLGPVQLKRRRERLRVYELLEVRQESVTAHQAEAQESCSCGVAAAGL